MAVGDKYLFISDKMVAIRGDPIEVGSKVICMSHNQGIINPGYITVGANVVVFPASSGKVAVKRRTVIVDEMQHWYDADFQSSAVQYYSSEFTGGTYKLTVAGWFTIWNDYDSRLICDESYSGHPKFISCCRNALRLIINGSEYRIGSICTTRDLPNLTGYGTISIPSGATVGVILYDYPYHDNHGDTTFKLEGPI